MLDVEAWVIRNLEEGVDMIGERCEVVLPQAKVELARAEKIPTPISSRYLEVNLGLTSSELPSNTISIWKNGNYSSSVGATG